MIVWNEVLLILKIKKMDKKWWLLYCRGWKKKTEYEERVLLIVVVVIDCGVSTTVNTTILLIYILIYIMFNFCLLKNPWKFLRMMMCLQSVWNPSKDLSQTMLNTMVKKNHICSSQSFRDKCQFMYRELCPS